LTRWTYSSPLADVGNKAAVFPLQLLGFDVDVINSVHFSNHTGYPHRFEGDVLNGAQLLSILMGLERNRLLEHVGHILTGYIGSESFLRSVIQVIQTVRKNRKDSQTVRYICDPVLGDMGKFYVPIELVDIYRTDVIPLADVITPNQFEVEQLTGISIRSHDDAKLACLTLHNMGPALVIITSLCIEGSERDSSDVPNKEEKITVLASQRKKNDTENSEFLHEMWSIQTPIIDGRFTGTGDLCAALILGWTAKEPNNLKEVMEKVISTMFSVIQLTHNHMKAESEKDGQDNFDYSVGQRELRLIQSKSIIENPVILFEAYNVKNK
jgi:pyridoxine kinase